MYCNSANMLRQAANAIDPKKDRFGYAFSLEELARHIDQVRKGAVSLDEFATFYMIRPEPHPTEGAAS